jgi:thiol-disulfide isomerase/thioredoxin
MKRIIAAAVTIMIMISGCASPSASSASSSSASSSASSEKNLADEYTSLSSDNHFYYEEKDSLKDLMGHGTAVLYLGFPECPWCQSYAPLLEEVLADTDMKCAYYNIHTDKTEDRDFYDMVASLLVSQNDTGEDIIKYDNDGKQTIYMPLVLFISSGRIIAFNNETCTEDSDVISPEDYWTDDKKTALNETLTADVRQIKTAQTENSEDGCDTGCEVKG